MKTVLITGTSSGIGAALVDKFASERWHVYSAMRSPVADSRKNVTVIQMDVTDKATINNGIQSIINEQGKLDVLVNNAGYGNRFSLFEETSGSELRKQMDTNFWGSVDLCREALPHMRQSDSGNIINVTSVAGSTGFPYGSGYGASKFALRGFCLCIAEEVRRYSVNVTSFEPGMVKTRIATSAHHARDVEIPEYNAHFSEIEAYVDKIHKMYATRMATPADKVANRLFKLANKKSHH